MGPVDMIPVMMALHTCTDRVVIISDHAVIQILETSPYIDLIQG
jgi:hypothetical protein